MPPATPRRAHILVIDDDPFVTLFMSDALGSEGYEVETAANGREGLEKIVAQPYDLILSDLRMPELDGPVGDAAEALQHERVVAGQHQRLVTRQLPDAVEGAVHSRQVVQRVE